MFNPIQQAPFISQTNQEYLLSLNFSKMSDIEEVEHNTESSSEEQPVLLIDPNQNFTVFNTSLDEDSEEENPHLTKTRFNSNESNLPDTFIQHFKSFSVKSDSDATSFNYLIQQVRRSENPNYILQLVERAHLRIHNGENIPFTELDCLMEQVTLRFCQLPILSYNKIAQFIRLTLQLGFTSKAVQLLAPLFLSHFHILQRAAKIDDVQSLYPNTILLNNNHDFTTPSSLMVDNTQIGLFALITLILPTSDEWAESYIKALQDYPMLSLESKPDALQQITLCNQAALMLACINTRQEYPELNTLSFFTKKDRSTHKNYETHASNLLNHYQSYFIKEYLLSANTIPEPHILFKKYLSLGKHGEKAYFDAECIDAKTAIGAYQIILKKVIPSFHLPYFVSLLCNNPHLINMEKSLLVACMLEQFSAQVFIDVPFIQSCVLKLIEQCESSKIPLSGDRLRTALNSLVQNNNWTWNPKHIYAESLHRSKPISSKGKPVPPPFQNICYSNGAMLWKWNPKQYHLKGKDLVVSAIHVAMEREEADFRWYIVEYIHKCAKTFQTFANMIGIKNSFIIYSRIVLKAEITLTQFQKENIYFIGKRGSITKKIQTIYENLPRLDQLAVDYILEHAQESEEKLQTMDISFLRMLTAPQKINTSLITLFIKNLIITPGCTLNFLSQFYDILIESHAFKKYAPQDDNLFESILLAAQSLFKLGIHGLKLPVEPVTEQRQNPILRLFRKILCQSICLEKLWMKKDGCLTSPLIQTIDALIQLHEADIRKSGGLQDSNPLPQAKNILEWAFQYN